MVKLYDASILTGPPLRAGAQIMAQGREGGTHVLSQGLEALDVTQSYPTMLSKGDTITLAGTEYRVSGLNYLSSYVEYAGGRSGDTRALLISLTGVADRSAETRLLVPLDGQTVPYDGTLGEAISVMHVSYVEDLSGYPWAEISRDDDFRVDVTCFTTGTLIETERGLQPVQRLRVGDLVRTRDHGMQPLRWLGGRQLSGAELGANPGLHPIRIAAGALGPGLPARDLIVSPQHRMLVRSVIAQRMTGSAEVLIAAVHLLGHPGIDRVEAQGSLGYWHLMFDRHEIVFAEGAEAESLYLGPMALAALTRDAVRELHALFPELVSAGGLAEPQPTARPVMRGKPVARLIERQLRNLKPLVTAA